MVAVRFNTPSVITLANQYNQIDGYAQKSNIGGVQACHLYKHSDTN